MYVTFPVSVRAGLELRARYAPQGGFSAVVIRLRLPDGRLYGQTGQLNFVDNTVAQTTDTVLVRGAIANPLLHDPSTTGVRCANLPTANLSPSCWKACSRSRWWRSRAPPCCPISRATMSSRSAPDNKAEQRRIQLGQSTTTVGRHHQRARARRQGDRRGPAAGASGPARLARAGQPADPVQHEGRASDGVTRQMARAAGGAKPAGNAHDFRRLRRPSASCDRDRLRHHHRGRAGAAANPRGAIPRHRAAAGHGHRRLPGRLRGGGGDQRRPAARGPGGRRRPDALHEVDQRQRRQLHAHRLVRARHQSRHQHRQRQQPRSDRAVATAARGAAAGPDVQKKSSAILQFIVLYSANGEQDPLFITNYAIINVLDAISRTPGSARPACSPN